MKQRYARLLALAMLVVITLSSSFALAEESEKYDPPITMSFGTPIDVNDANIINLEKQTGETIYDNRWTRLMKDELGIIVDYAWLAPGEQYAQKLRLGMASNSLPDYFRLSDYSDLKNMIEAGIVMDMTDIYEEYASPLLKQITEAETDHVFDSMTYEGRLYGIPAKMPSTNAYNHLWIRRDWLKKLGIEEPKTMEDVRKVAEAFATQDPDGNGIADTRGILLDKNFLTQAKGLFWGFGALVQSPTQWIKAEDGTLVYSKVQPEVKNALVFLNEMYNEGLIDMEFAVKDFNKAVEDVVNGKCGMFYGQHWDAFQLENSIKNDPDADWISLPLPTEDGSLARIPATVTVEYAIVTSAGAEHPEGIIKILNKYVETLFGEDNQFDTYYAEEGLSNIWNQFPIYALDSRLDLQAHLDIKQALADGTTDQLTGVGKSFYDLMNQEDTHAYALMFGPEKTPFDFVAQTYPDNIVWNEYAGAPTATMATRWTTLEEHLLVNYTKMITGQVPLDSFDSVIEQWNSMGGADVTREINEAAAAAK